MKDWALPAADRYFRPLLSERGFQVEHLDAALGQVRQWRCAVDGGAHIGTWAVAMAERFGRVIAFEPAPDTFECLWENTLRLENVIKIQAALGSARGSASIVDDPARPGNTGARYIGGPGNTAVVALDDFGLQDLDLLKLDVEGYELFALQGAAQTLGRCKPVVVMEVKDLGRIDPEEAVRYIAALGYREVARTRNDRVYIAH